MLLWWRRVPRDSASENRPSGRDDHRCRGPVGTLAVEDGVGPGGLASGNAVALGCTYDGADGSAAPRGTDMVQPFLTAASLDLPARICVVAFSVAIPLLAALVLVNRRELSRHRATRSRLVIWARVVAQNLAFVGAVAGFWHISWIAGVGMLASGLMAVAVHAAGYLDLKRDQTLTAPAVRLGSGGWVGFGGPDAGIGAGLGLRSPSWGWLLAGHPGVGRLLVLLVRIQ